ncbi:MAG: hypothetical protein RIE73_24770 [Coleofasciculus sp. C1-SOL-03]
MARLGAWHVWELGEIGEVNSKLYLTHCPLPIAYCLFPVPSWTN